MRTPFFLIPVLAVVAAGLGVTIAEHSAHNHLDSELRTAVSTMAAKKDITGTNVRGRPYLLSDYNEEISTAYVELDPPPGATRLRLLVQNLNLDTHRANRVRTLVLMPYPAADAKLAKYAKTVSSKLTGEGRTIRYRGEVRDGELIVTARGGSAPAPVRLEGLRGSDIPRVQVQAAEDGLGVDIEALDVQLADR